MSIHTTKSLLQVLAAMIKMHSRLQLECASTVTPAVA